MKTVPKGTVTRKAHEIIQEADVKVRRTRNGYKLHHWDGETFSDTGHPVAKCNPRLRLYPRILTLSEYADCITREGSCKKCFPIQK